MVEAEGALLRPLRRPFEELGGLARLSVVDGDDRRGVAHRPVNERRCAGGLLQDARVVIQARVREGTYERGEPAAQESDPFSSEPPRIGYRHECERLRLLHRRVALALERIEERLDEQPLLERRIPCRPFHRSRERTSRRFDPPVRGVRRRGHERRDRLLVRHTLDRPFPRPEHALHVARHQEAPHPPAREERRHERHGEDERERKQVPRILPSHLRDEHGAHAADHDRQERERAQTGRWLLRGRHYTPNVRHRAASATERAKSAYLSPSLP